MSGRGQKGDEDSSVQLSNTYNYKGTGGGLLIGELGLIIETSSISSSIQKQSYIQSQTAASFEKSSQGKKSINFNDTAPSSVLQSARESGFNQTLEEINVPSKSTYDTHQQYSTQQQFFQQVNPYVPMSATNSTKKHFDFNETQSQGKRTDSAKRIQAAFTQQQKTASQATLKSQTNRHGSHASLSKAAFMMGMGSGKKGGMQTNSGGLPPIDQQLLHFQQQRAANQDSQQLYYSSKLYAGLATQRYGKQAGGQ